MIQTLQAKMLHNACWLNKTTEAVYVCMQLTKELEAAKARVEDEMIATVQIATGLEGRLREARAEADLAQQQAQQADQRAHQVR